MPRLPSSFATSLLVLLSSLPLVAACANEQGSAPTDGPTLPPRGSGEGQETMSSTQRETDDASKSHARAVAFIHGTSDHGGIDGLVCGGTGDEWRCVSETAVAEYWTQPTIDSERMRTDGTLRPYVVIGCPLSSQTPWPNPTPVKPKGGPAEPGSAACVAAELAKFIDGPDGVAGTDDDIRDLALITHSGGSNVVRYILQQHSARPEFGKVHAAARGFIAIAAPSMGTYLADRVFGFGLLSLGDALLKAGYDDDGVDFIQTSKMALFNRDPAKLVDLSKDVAGVPAYMASGGYPDKDGDEAKVACGGASETKGLNALHELYLDSTDEATARDDCSDGFISCKSAMALAQGDESRVIFGVMDGKTIGRVRFRAHNQSRRDCDGIDVDVRGKVNDILEARGTGGTDGKGFFGRSRSGHATELAPFTPAMRPMLRSARRGGVALEVASSTAHGGETMRVRVDTSSDPSTLQGLLEDPSGERVVMSFERIDGHLYAVGQLPPDARAGAWIARVGLDATDRGDDARVPFWVSRSTGAIRAARAVREGGEIVLRVTIAAGAPRRLGVHATLVAESSAGPLTVGRAQASADTGPDGAAELTVRFASGAGLSSESLSVRELVLVSHDDATTLDVRDRVELQR